VRTAGDPTRTHAELARRWENVALISAGRVWEHKGIEYDGVVVDTSGMTPHEVYLAASRAAHELVIVH
jgi:chloramphenicol 3-O-phosphotransferase